MLSLLSVFPKLASRPAKSWIFRPVSALECGAEVLNIENRRSIKRERERERERERGRERET